MPRPKIIAIETAVPPFRVTQKDALEFVRSRSDVKPETLKWYQRFLSDPGIESRHFGVNSLTQIFQENADETLVRFQNTAASLGAEALTRALAAADLKPEDLDGIVVTTCTGYLCPGLTSHIASKVNLRKDIYALDLAGLGCGAAIPGLRAASNFLESKDHGLAAVICVEVCSAAMYWDNDIDLILSNAIFSDGAACAILSSDEHPGLELQSFGSLLLEEHRDDLRFQSRNGRLCNVIRPTVPKIAAQTVSDLLQSCHEEFRGGFDFAAVHPGGRKVLDLMEETIPTFKGKLEASRKILKHYGNMSSPTVLFVLKEILSQAQYPEGNNLLLVSFGAGFTAYCASLKVKALQSLKRLSFRSKT